MEDELSDEGVRDGGAWRQPFYYKDLAHVIIPRKFIFNKDLSDPLKEFEMVQDIFGLSEYLKKHNLAHNLHDWALDVKVF